MWHTSQGAWSGSVCASSTQQCYILICAQVCDEWHEMVQKTQSRGHNPGDPELLRMVLRGPIMKKKNWKG